MATSIFLICAVLASLAIGVLSAYGLCLAMFRLFRMHTTQILARSNVLAPISTSRS